MVDTGLTKCYYLGDEVSVYDSLIKARGVPNISGRFSYAIFVRQALRFSPFPQGLPICFEVITCRSSTAITAASTT